MPNLRDFLAEVSTEPQSLPTAMVLYAPPGLGKTSIAAAIPGVVFAVDRDELEGVSADDGRHREAESSVLVEVDVRDGGAGRVDRPDGFEGRAATSDSTSH